MSFPTHYLYTKITTLVDTVLQTMSEKLINTMGFPAAPLSVVKCSLSDLEKSDTDGKIKEAMYWMGLDLFEKVAEGAISFHRKPMPGTDHMAYAIEVKAVVDSMDVESFEVVMNFNATPAEGANSRAADFQFTINSPRYPKRAAQIEMAYAAIFSDDFTPFNVINTIMTLRSVGFAGLNSEQP